MRRRRPFRLWVQLDTRRAPPPLFDLWATFSTLDRAISRADALFGTCPGGALRVIGVEVTNQINESIYLRKRDE